MNGSILKLTQVSQFASDNVNSASRGVTGLALAGQVTNLDLKLTDDAFITGGVLRTYTSAFGDTATFQVVDVENLLGYGENVVLGQYINEWHMRSDVQEQINEITTYPAKILSGLYLRIIYTSTGDTDVLIAANYRLHKILY